MKRLPVVTSGEIPKGRIFDIMNELNRLEVTAPIKLNDVLIKNVLGLGVDIVATRSLLY
jgi:CxxC motif-containing protein